MWVLGLPSADAETQEATGWFLVTDTTRPDDTETHTHDRSVELVNGTPTVVWTQREKSFAEQESSAPDLTEVLSAKLVAAENESPQPWKQPEGAHDAYLPGAIVTDGVGGVQYRNDLPIPNVWGIFTHGWVPVDQPVGPQPWVQPQGAHDAYQIGDQILWTDGNVYSSTINANTYSPATYPAGWQLV
jgi:hypothetical protein